MEDLDNISVEHLNLSARVFHALQRNGIFVIGDLKRYYAFKHMYQSHLIGKKSLAEITAALNALQTDLGLQNILKKADGRSVVREEEKQDEQKQNDSTQDFPIDILDIPISIKRTLNKNGIKTVNQLRNIPDTILAKMRLAGSVRLTEIRNSLEKNISYRRELLATESVINESVVDLKMCITWAEIVEGYFRKEKDSYSYILIKRFGLAPKTLEEIALDLGVTRERIRQIQEVVAVRYLKHARLSGAIELLEKIEEIFSTHGEELSLPSFEGILIQEGFLGKFSEPLAKGHIKNLDLLETLVCWLHLLSDKRYSLQPMEFSIDISNLVRSGRMSIKDRATLLSISSKARRQIKRKVLFTGGITIKEATKILSVDERVAVFILESLNLKKVDKEWFSFNNLDDDKDNSKIPLRIAGLKMLAIIPELEIGVFHEGLRKHSSRFYSNIAPVHVVSHVLPMLGFNINGARVSTRLPTKGVLSQSENTLISAISKNQGVASFLEIAEEFFLQRLSLPAVSVTLKRSPIAEKADEGLYNLRGMGITWQQVEDAKKRQKRFSQDSEVTYGLDGVVRMKLTVSSYAFLTGVVGSYGIRELSGSWPVIHDGESFGEAKIDDVYLWGLAKLFKKLDIKMGERI